MASRSDILAGGATFKISADASEYTKELDALIKSLKTRVNKIQTSTAAALTAPIANQVIAKSIEDNVKGWRKLQVAARRFSYTIMGGMKNALTYLISAGNRINILGNQITNFGKQLVVFGILLAAPFLYATNAYAKFSKELGFIATQLDEPGKYLESYKRDLRKFSIEFGDSTESLSRGLYDILSSGFEAEYAMRMLRIAAISAKGGMTDTATSIKALIGILNSYGYSAEYAESVSDSLFQTVKFGVMTYEDLASHIGLVSASAAQMGVTLDELGATLAVITLSGVETSTAIVGLQNVLKAFSAPTGEGQEFAKTLREAGLDIELSVSAIKKSGFLNIMQKIGKLPPEAIARLFTNIRSQRAMFALRANLDRIYELYDKFENKTGATRRAFEETNKMFGAFTDRLKQAGILMLSVIGETLSDRLTKLSEKILDIASGFSEWIKRHETLVGNIPRLIVFLAKLSLATMVVGKTIAVVGSILAAFTGSLWKIPVAIAAAVGTLIAVDAVSAKIARDLEEIQEFRDVPIGIATNDAERDMRGLNAEIAVNNKRIRDYEKIIASISMSAAETGGVLLDSDRKRLEQYKDKLNFLKKNDLALKKELSEQDKLYGKEIERRKLLKDQVDMVTKQAGTLGKTRYGFQLGFMHTLHLKYSSEIKENEQLEVLKDIRNNTGEMVKSLPITPTAK